MADEQHADIPNDEPNDEQHQPQQQSGGSTATLPAPSPVRGRPKLDRMPPWKVLLHNDDHNDMGHVVKTICSLTALDPQVALQRMLEAHTQGVAMLLSTHQEHAELLAEQFASKQLTVTIEKDA